LVFFIVIAKTAFRRHREREPMKISDIMNDNVARTSPDERFGELLSIMRDKPSRLLHVVDAKDKLLGVITSYDVLKVMLPFYMDSNLARAMGGDEEIARQMLKENAHLTARDIMVPAPKALRESSGLLEAEALVRELAINALPVVDEAGRVVGEVTRQDMLSRLIALCAPAPGES
jgi:CBS-domain-containing membrane protein